jgi:DHA1 family tetracycline resistance protein-like MFS transporter
MADALPSRAPRRAALIFIFITVLLDMLAIGLVVPVLPNLVLAFRQGDTVSAAEIFGVFGTAWALMQFFFSPVLGALSDRFGRRPVILLSNLGLGLDYILMALAPTLGWLFVGRVISGMTAASISTAFAYIADVTPGEKRAAAFGMVGVAFGLGFVLGPAAGGLLGAVDLRLPFWVAAALSLLNFFYGLLVLPESLPADRRSPFAWRRANPIGSLVLLRSYPELLGLSSVNFLHYLAHAVLPSVFVLYAGYRYGWTERDVGLALAGVGIFSAIVQGGLIKPIVAWAGERNALLIGLACGALGFAIYGVAPTGAIFCLGVPVMALWGLTGPAVQALMSQRVGPTEQGQLQGAQSSLQGVANLIGPGLFTATFALAIAPQHRWEAPGTPFVLAALMLMIAMVVGARAAKPPKAGAP